MEGLDLKRALDVATKAALAAGELIRAEFHRAGGPRHEGQDHAAVDQEAELLIRAALERAFPDFDYVGEETGSSTGRPGAPTWYVDPNDGTRPFLEGHRGSAVSIALVVDGLPVLGVVYAPCAPTDAGDLVTWAEGQPLRRDGVEFQRAPLAETLTNESVVLLSQHGDRASEANAAVCAPARFRTVPSIAYRCALVAAGEGEAAVSLNSPVAWDFAAGHAVLRGAGGELVDERGQPIRYGPEGAGSRYVFGGSLQAMRALASRPWRDVLRRGSDEVHAAPLRPSPAWKVADPGLLDRAQGALFGQLIGDALGQMVEFRTEADIRHEFPQGVLELRDGGAWNTLAGQPTDDSEMALALARSLVAKGDFDAQAVRTAYVGWLESGPFDIGATTSAGLLGSPNHESQANGALMRVSPLGIFGHARSADEVAAPARADAAITHPNPVCGDASAVFAVAVAHAVRTGEAPRQVWQAALDWGTSRKVAPSILEALQGAEQSPPREYYRQMGWVLIALRNAFYQLLSAPSAEAGLVDTVRRGGDTDTNGAIAGALLGAVHGGRSLPLRWTRSVHSCRPLANAKPRPREYWPVDAAVLAEALVLCGRR